LDEENPMLFLDLLIAPLTAPIHGVTWIADKILEQAGDPLDEKETLKKQLLALQLAFDLGDIPEEEFEEQEEALLLAIQAIEDQEATDES
jgi:type III secretion system FlhB-like substrate exporter